jgi:hypothetical protein
MVWPSEKSPGCKDPNTPQCYGICTFPVLTVISGFHCDVEIYALLGYYAASCGNCLPTYWYNVSVPSSRVFWDSWPVKMGPIICPETSVNNYHTVPCNIPEERRSHFLCCFIFCVMTLNSNLKCLCQNWDHYYRSQYPSYFTIVLKPAWQNCC